VREGLNLNGIDLNLLPKFRALYRHRNVSEAGRELHLTQSAISNALARMRSIFGDELFVRSGNCMEPTPLAHSIARPIDDALAKLEGEFSHIKGFEPESSSRVFKIAMTQLAEAWLAPHILALARSVAPYIVVSSAVSGDHGFEIALSSGGLDFAVGHLTELGNGFRDVKLGMHEIVCMMRADHPVLRRQPLTLSTLLSCTFAYVLECGTYGALSHAIEKIAPPDAMRYRTANVMALPLVIAKTDLVALVPAWFGARCTQSLGLRLIRIGSEPMVSTVRLFWHKHFESDPGHLWMRSVISRAASAAQIEEALQTAATTSTVSIISPDSTQQPV
jgi:DNA-binding transcriptional LysR family regulator